MSNEKIQRSVSQGGIHFVVSMPKEVSDKMGEIARRSPEGAWASRGMELMDQAKKELKEQASQQNPQPEQ